MTLSALAHSKCDVARNPSREEVVAEALSWVGTPYHLRALVKGAGCDCATFLMCVYRACGLLPGDEAVEWYSYDWFAQASSERYLAALMRHAPLVAETIARRSTEALPGAIVLSRCVKSRFYNHGGIVIRWPQVIHAVNPEVEQCCAMDHRLWTHHEIAILDPFIDVATDEEIARMERATGK